MKRKKLILVLMSVFMILGLLPGTAFAYGTGGNCGAPGNEGGVRWSLEDDTLVISGNGDMADYELPAPDPGFPTYGQEAPWYSYLYRIRHIRVEEGVTSVGEYAFCYADVESVSLPSTLQIIKEKAFEDAGADYIDFDGLSQLRTIGEFAFEDFETEKLDFSGCTSLEEIKMFAFMGSTADTIILPESLKTIGSYAFQTCYQLSSLILYAKQAPETPEDDFGLFHGCSRIPDIYILCGSEGYDSGEWARYESSIQVLAQSHVFDQMVVSDEYLKSAATCTEPAVYYKSCSCGQKGTETFESGEPDPDNHDLVHHEGKEPTEEEAGWKPYDTCTRCGYTTYEELPKLPVYTVISGADSVYAAGSQKDVVIKTDGDFDKFTGVKLDGEWIDSGNYTAESGSTILTLKAGYLDSLDPGEHKLTFIYTDGEVSTVLTVREKESPETHPEEDPVQPQDPSGNTQTVTTGSEAPQTGDYAPVVFWAALFLVSAVVIYREKKYFKE